MPAATAILHRFLHHAEMIQITGRSYRLRKEQNGLAKENQDPEPDRPTDSPNSKTGQGASRAQQATDGTAAKKGPSKEK